MDLVILGGFLKGGGHNSPNLLVGKHFKAIKRSIGINITLSGDLGFLVSVFLVDVIQLGTKNLRSPEWLYFDL